MNLTSPTNRLSEDRRGGFICPHCKEVPACDCEACAKHPTNRKICIIDKETDIVDCPYCHNKYSLDESFETEMESLKLTD